MPLAPLSHLDTQTCQNLQLIASDLDGTLTLNGQFAAAFIATLAQLARVGLPLVIVTGRSAGWVQGLAQYLPVAGAIAENGGLGFFPPDYAAQFLVDLPNIAAHRKALASCFEQLQADWPQLVESSDNRFRLTDWTFEVAGLEPGEIEAIAQRCTTQGWGFTYSTVQCHIRPQGQDKGIALQQVMAARYPELGNHQVVTLGDSPNDAGLFDPARFPCSVGVANLRHYAEQLPHCPAYITEQEAFLGFQELAATLITAKLESPAYEGHSETERVRDPRLLPTWNPNASMG